MAEGGTLAITSPESGSATVDAAPAFSGTTNGTSNPVALRVYRGSSVSGSPIQGLETLVPVDGEWTLTPLLGQGVYTAVASELNEEDEEETSLPVVFTVEAAPEVTEDPVGATVLVGEPASFTASATGTPAPEVQWQVSTDGGASWSDDSSDAGATTDTLTVAAAKAAENGWEYRAVYTNAAGKATSTPAVLTVEELPVVTAQPQPVTVTAGETASFSASASGLPAPSVQWQESRNEGKSWSNVSGGTSDTLTLAGTTFSQNLYEYRAVFRNAAGNATSNPAVLTVQTIPVVTTNPKSDTVDVGETATFTTAASGSPFPKVRWQVLTPGGKWKNDTTDSGNASDTLTVAAVTLADSGNQYRAVFTNAAGEATSNPATLTVQEKPLVTTEPKSVAVLKGESATFTAGASGSPAPAVQWQVSSDGGAAWSDDTGDAGNTTDTLTVAGASAAENGWEYRAVFTSAAGEATSSAATLTVEEKPAVTANPSNATASVGANATFTATASGVPAPGVQWQVSTDSGAEWHKDTTDSGNTTDTLTVASVTLAESGWEYRAVFTNSAGEATSAAATLTVQAKPQVTTEPSNATVDAGRSASFTAAAAGTPAPSVQWQVSTDGGSGWSNDTTDPGNTTGTLTITAASGSENGYEYRAVFTNAAGSADSTAATLTVDEGPVVTLEPSSEAVVSGKAATFTAAASGNPAPTVQWQISTNGGASWSNDTADSGDTTDTLTVAAVPATDNGNEYRAVFTNTVASAASDAATLTVESVPTVTTNPKSTAVLKGESATFTAAASGSPAPTVQWQVSTNGGTSWEADAKDAGGTSDTLTVADTTAAENGYEYRAVFENAHGSAISTAAKLTVETAPAVTTNPTAANVVVLPPATGTAEFTAAASGNPKPTVQWQVSTDGGAAWSNDTSDAGNTTDTLTVSGIKLAESGWEYRAVFESARGTATSAAAALTVEEAPAVTTEPAAAAVAEGQTATFTAAATGLPAPTVQWQVSTDGGVTWSEDTADQGATTDTLKVEDVGPADEGFRYRAVFTNDHGTATSGEATLTVEEPPVITTTPKDVAVVAGESAAFTAAAEGKPEPTVQWQVSANGGASWTNDTADSGNATHTLTVEDTVPSDNAREYRAAFTNAAGTTYSSAATLTVESEPVVTLQPADASVQVGRPATFTVAASGTPAPATQWQVSTDGGSTWETDTGDAGKTSDTLTVSATPVDNGNQYRAVFSNEIGEGAQRKKKETMTQPATLTVGAPEVTAEPVSEGVDVGQSATFTAAAVGTPTPTVQWEVSSDFGGSWAPDTSDGGNTTDALTVASVSAALDGYEYRAVFTNEHGRAESSPATLTVATPAPPAPSPAAAPPGPPSASFEWLPSSPHTGETVTLVSNSTDASSALSGFEWSLAGNGLFAGGGPVDTTSFASAGDHVVQLRVTAADGLSGAVSETIPVTAPALSLMQPFPVVRIAGSFSASGAKISLLTVAASPGSHISITCHGHHCPAKLSAQVTASSKGKVGVVLVSFRSFERSLSAGVILEIRVWKAGEIGKYTSFAVHHGKLPTRVDTCLDPNDSQPMTCPA